MIDVANKNIMSFRHSRLNLLLFLFFYLIVYSAPNIFGLASTENPAFFAMWSILSLALVFMIGLLGFATNREKSTRLFLPFFLLSISTVLTLSVNGVSLSRFNDAIIPIIIALVFYVLLGNQALDQQKFVKFSKLFISFVLFTCFYNLIVNFGEILKFGAITNSYEFVISSFYENRNTFAFLLSLGITLAIYMHRIRALSRFRFMLIILVLGSSLVMTLSRGAIIIASIFSLIFYFQSGTISFIRYILMSLIIVVSAYTILGSSFISNNLIREDAGLTRRDVIQAEGIEYYSSRNILVGTNDGIRRILKDEYKVTSLHSTYIDILVTGGLLKVATYVMILLTIFRRIKIIKAYDLQSAYYFSSLLLAYLLYATIETTLPFGLSPTSTTTTVFIFILPIYISNHYLKNATPIKKRLV